MPVGSVSVLVYPIDEDLQWTLDCTHEILQYAYDCGLMVANIDKDVHTYGHLPKTQDYFRQIYICINTKIALPKKMRI